MRATFPTFFRRELRCRPFVLALTDLHQSNVLVDRDWHFTSIVDLEWRCSKSIEMIQLPYWLTDESVDLMRAAEYDEIRREFMESCTAEEERFFPLLAKKGCTEWFVSCYGTGMEKAGVLVFSCAYVSNGLFSLLYNHIQTPLTVKATVHEAFYEVMP